ncbi:transcriptional regulator [Cytobacillus depressus]|uniref:Transcriptional regulator n=1 Tax=Cytobacillus depressus TaxID=1602942 RepID=A0A6L3V8V7_9BACI|nr:transcriptional regulator [Cytobacillus depressus]KAB2338040.1 transcriptional regulator [Cytobacillus depressus]
MIRIAVIGSERVVQRVIKKKNENTDFIPYIYKTPEEAPSLVNKIENDIQVLLFVGPIPYFLAEEEITKKGLPAIYIQTNEYNIALSLYYIHNILQKKTYSISIDISNQDYVFNVFQELQLNPETFFVREYADDYNTEQIYNYHYYLWKEKKVDFVLTSVEAIDVRLKQNGVNSLHMIKPDKNVQDAINQAVEMGKLRISKESQIAVGLISIENYNEIAAKSGDFVGQEISLKIHQLLIGFGKQIDASVLHLGKGQFVIYTTRGALAKVSNYYSELSISTEIKKLTGVTVCIGFGLGLSAKEAEQNAYIALHHAEKSNENKIYVVTDEKVVIGPLNNQNQQYSLRSMNQKILSISEKTAISVSNLSKISEFVKFRNFNSFSSNDLANYLELSKRSADRLLKKLLDNEIAEIIGEEQPYQKGRPRSIYKIDFHKIEG